MSEQTNKPLVNLTETQLKEKLRSEAQQVQYSYNTIVAESNRRAANRVKGAELAISLISLAISIAALMVAAAK